MKKGIKKIIFKKQEKSEKQRLCVRFPTEIREQLRVQSEKDYSGRGKQSRLVEDAIKYYIFTTESINWQEYEKDSDYAELMDDIMEGLNQPNLASTAQIFLSEDTIRELTKLETRVRLSSPLLNDVRTGIIRKAVSIRLSLGNKAFFDELMSQKVG